MSTRTPNLPREFTVDEVADYLRLCTKTVRRRIKEGKLTARREGGGWRIQQRDLLAYIADSK